VKLIPAQFVKPFVKSNKNDFLDAEAIAEAVDRQNMRFVPIKTDDQLDLQAMHRVRDRLVARRTAVINQLRAFLLERGMVFAKTPFKLKQAMPAVLVLLWAAHAFVLSLTCTSEPSELTCYSIKDNSAQLGRTSPPHYN
jgi:hypothetical protein